MQSIKLKEHGIYAFPDGRQFIARTRRDGSCALRGPLFSRARVLVDYSIDEKGQVTYEGEVTPWRIEDLIYKGLLAPADG